MVDRPAVPGRMDATPTVKLGSDASYEFARLLCDVVRSHPNLGCNHVSTRSLLPLHCVKMHTAPITS